MGCGVWPAWWTHCHTEGVIWPNGGELDILEHAGDLPGKVSFHTGAANDCPKTAENVPKTKENDPLEHKSLAIDRNLF